VTSISSSRDRRVRGTCCADSGCTTGEHSVAVTTSTLLGMTPMLWKHERAAVALPCRCQRLALGKRRSPLAARRPARHFALHPIVRSRARCHGVLALRPATRPDGRRHHRRRCGTTRSRRHQCGCTRGTGADLPSRTWSAWSTRHGRTSAIRVLRPCSRPGWLWPTIRHSVRRSLRSLRSSRSSSNPRRSHLRFSTATMAVPSTWLLGRRCSDGAWPSDQRREAARARTSGAGPTQGRRCRY
jgi:hypothetical protein